MRQISLRFVAPLLVLTLSLPLFGEMPADTPEAGTKTTLLTGMSAKDGAKGRLTIAGGSLILTTKDGKSEVKVPSIEAIYTGKETTQAGGNVGSAAKVGAIAAPYGAGAALSLILQTKVDLLTVVYRGEAGDLHGAMLVVPKGDAEKLKSALMAAGAHAKEGN